MVHYIADLIGRGLREIQADVPRLVRRHPAERRGDGPGVRPPAGRQVRHEAPLRERRVGDLLHARPPGAAVQARHPAEARAVPRSCSTAPRWRSRKAAPRSRSAAGRRGVALTVETMLELPLDPAGVPRGPGDARARRLGRARVRALRRAPRCSASSRRRPRPRRRAAREELRRVGRARDRLRRGRAQGAQEPGVLARDRSSPTGDHDYVDAADRRRRARSSRCPGRPGVVLALTPSTNPVATVYFKTLLALLTRNAIVISPHPLAKECCADAARMLAEAAVAAGAPDGVHPGGRGAVDPADQRADDRRRAPTSSWPPAASAVVRAAYRSGNPAIGVGPGNVPVLVDATADLAAAAKRIVDSKAFDNSILCTNESVLDRRGGGRRPAAAPARARRAPTCSTPTSATGSATLLFPGGQLRHRVRRQGRAPGSPSAGRGPGAGRAPGSCSRRSTWWCPRSRSRTRSCARCSAWSRVPTAAPRHRRGAAPSCASAGAGHSAAIHSTDPRTIMEYAAAVDVLRVSVNVGNSLGSSGHRHQPGAVDDDRHRLLRPLARWARTSSPSTW